MPQVSASKKNARWHLDTRIKVCAMCAKELVISSFSAYKYITNQGKASVRYESRCLSCNRLRREERSKNQDKRLLDIASSRLWKSKNKDKLAAYASAKQQDPYYKAIKSSYQRARKARIRAVSDVKDPRIKDLYKEAKMLEVKIRACVASDDDIDLQIHVDHIHPISAGGRHEFNNLQILSGRENLIKGVRIIRSAATMENNDA